MATSPDRVRLAAGDAAAQPGELPLTVTAPDGAVPARDGAQIDTGRDGAQIDTGRDGAQIDTARDGALEDTARDGAQDAPDPLAVRRVLLHRRIAAIGPDRIEIGPPRSAVVLPAVGFAVTAFLLAAIVLWSDALPFVLLPIMLLVSVVVLPLSGLGLVYAVFGANVVADRAGRNVSFKQRFLGLGVGTNELVPFWKIREFVVEDVARAQPHAGGPAPAHDIAQWQIALVKKSGKRLELGGFNVPRAREEEGLDVVMDVAEALAALTDAPVRGPIW